MLIKNILRFVTKGLSVYLGICLIFGQSTIDGFIYDLCDILKELFILMFSSGSRPESTFDDSLFFPVISETYDFASDFDEFKLKDRENKSFVLFGDFSVNVGDLFSNFLVWFGMSIGFLISISILEYLGLIQGSSMTTNGTSTSRFSIFQKDIKYKGKIFPPDNGCVVCLQSQFEVEMGVLSPCGHMPLCIEDLQEYLKKNQTCPTCRTGIESYQKVTPEFCSGIAEDFRVWKEENGAEEQKQTNPATV